MKKKMLLNNVLINIRSKVIYNKIYSQQIGTKHNIFEFEFE